VISASVLGKPSRKQVYVMSLFPIPNSTIISQKHGQHQKSNMGKKQPKTKVPILVSLISGGIAGGVEASLTYPFEFAKTRAQLRNDAGTPSPRNPFAVILKTYHNESLRALYKGCGTLVIGSIAKDAVRFMSFDAVKNAFRDPETGALTPGRNMLAGMSAGVVASIFAVTPSERVKTALIDDARGAKRYRSAIHAVRLILKEDGFIGLYRGFAGTTLKQASATSFRMGSYNIIKDFQVCVCPQSSICHFRQLMKIILGGERDISKHSNELSQWKHSWRCYYTMYTAF
jgi:solute carrier family 25 citrate transporter 1